MFKYHKIVILYSLSLLVIFTSCSDEKKIVEKIRPVRYMEVTTVRSERVMRFFSIENFVRFMIIFL